MHHLMHIYLQFWAHNTYVSLFIHAMLAFFITAGIQTIREDRRHHFYHRSTYRDMLHARTEAEDEERMDFGDYVGCCFPGKCCMPGVHLRSECHTAEMMEAMIEDEHA